jgi:heme/copper-type cytochrome/quinol oxidase subunit 3
MAVAQAELKETEVRQVEPEPHLEYPRLSVGVMGMYIFLASEVMFFGSLFAAYFYLIGSHPFGWPPPGTHFVNVWPLPTVNTVVLVSSGVTCHFALEALRHGRPLGRTGIFASSFMALGVALLLVFGILSLGGGYYFEAGLCIAGIILLSVGIMAALGRGPFDQSRRTFYALWISTILLGLGFEIGQVFEFVTSGLNLTTNIFTSAFFTMTGFHGLHVAGGLVLLTLILGRALKGQFSQRHHVGPAAITLYWHFVDVVWLFLYSILYFAVTINS